MVQASRPSTFSVVRVSGARRSPTIAKATTPPSGISTPARAPAAENNDVALRGVENVLAFPLERSDRGEQTAFDQPSMITGNERSGGERRLHPTPRLDVGASGEVATHFEIQGERGSPQTHQRSRADGRCRGRSERSQPPDPQPQPPRFGRRSASLRRRRRRRRRGNFSRLFLHDRGLLLGLSRALSRGQHGIDREGDGEGRRGTELLAVSRRERPLARHFPVRAQTNRSHEL